MQRTNPFARALAVMALVQAAAGDALKLAEIPAYKSRGKGRGQHSGKKWGPRPSYRDMVQVDHATRGTIFVQKDNGYREVARRMRQIETGKLRVSA